MGQLFHYTTIWLYKRNKALSKIKFLDHSLEKGPLDLFDRNNRTKSTDAKQK